MSFEGSSYSGHPLYSWLKVFVAGLCVGAADIIPGISGGTVALILGIYSRLIESLKSFDKKAFFKLAAFRFNDFSTSVHWQFLSALTAGMLCSLVVLSQFVADILQDEIYRTYLYSAFFGLIIASTVFCIKQMRAWKLFYLAFIAAGAIIAHKLTDWSFEDKSLKESYNVAVSLEKPLQPVRNYDFSTHQLKRVSASTLSAMVAKKQIKADAHVEKISTGELILAKEFMGAYEAHYVDFWIVCCGALAISAMLLPGISGSYILTILGVYNVVITALAEFASGIKNWSFEVEPFSVLLSMALGIIIGAFLFSHAVCWMLKRHHDATIASLTGFMLGALRSVWPFWSYGYSFLPLRLDAGPQLETLEPILPDVFSPLFLKASLLAVLGFLTVIFFERIAKSYRKELPSYS